MPLTHPAIVFALAAVAWLGVDRVLGGSPRARHIALAAGLTIGCAALISYVAVVAWYALRPVYFDPAESTITAVSWVFALGKPLYPALNAPERYAHIYGPDLFIIHAAAMRIFGARVVVSKAVGAISALASVLLTYAAFVGLVPRRAALIASGACALVYLAFGDITFWTRPDPLLILCSGAALYGVSSGKRLRSIVFVAVALAVSVNVKFSGPLYILPPLIVLTARSHRRDWIAVAAISIALAVLPFFISTISITHYLEYIQLSARHGLVFARLRQNIEWALVLSAPLAAAVFTARGSRARPLDPFTAAVIVTMVVVVAIAAKPGAGPYHLVPAVPLLAYAALSLPMAVWDSTAPRTMAAALVITSCVFAFQRQFVLIRTVRASDGAEAIADVRAFLDGHPSASVGVGYAGTSRWSDARVEAVFRTGDYWLDAPAVQEHRLAGLAIPEATMSALRECRTQYWLVPIGGDPFAVPSAYWPGAGPPRVFSDDFRQAFLHAYRRIGETGRFTIWECFRAAPASEARNAFPGARTAK